MKAKKIALCILSILIVLLSISIGLLLNVKTPELAQEENVQVYSVTEIPIKEFAAVSIKNNDMSFGVLQTDVGIEVITDIQGNYDTTQIRTLIYAICNLTADRKIENQNKFVNYGIDEPRSIVTLIQVDGSKEQFSILLDDPQEQGTYIYSHNQKVIYRISKEIAHLFLRKETDFFSHTILPIKTVEDVEKISELNFVFADELKNYTLESREGGYYLSKPIIQKVNTIGINGQLMDTIVKLYANKVEDSKGQLSVYGLSQPLLKLTVNFADTNYEIHLGKDEQNNYWMAEKGKNYVYSIEEDLVYLLMQDYQNWMAGVALYYSAGDLAQIQAITDKSSHLLQFKGSGKDLILQDEKGKFTKEEQTAFMKALNGLILDGQISTAVTNKSMLTLTVTTKTGVTEKWSFIPMDENHVAVAFNENTNFAISTEVFMELYRFFN